MAYIGRQNLGGAYRQLDDISSGFDGSDTTHTMQVNSQNVTVGDVNQIILSLGGVIQKPGTDFTVSGSVLTFTTAPAANTSFFAILLGSDNGGTVTPTDGSVTPGKTTFFNSTSLSDADLGAGLHIKTGDSGASANAQHDEIVIENSGNSGLSILSGNTSNGAICFGDDGNNSICYIDYDHNTNAMQIGVNNAAVMDISSDGEVTKPKQPAFIASVSSTQSNIANSDTVTMPEISGTDRNSDFASNTFTAPVTGLYQFNFSVSVTEKDETATYDRVTLVTSNRVYKFGITAAQMFDSAPSYHVYAGSTLADMDAGDTAKLRWDQSGGSTQADVFDSSYFSGFLVM